MTYSAIVPIINEKVKKRLYSESCNEVLPVFMHCNCFAPMIPYYSDIYIVVLVTSPVTEIIDPEQGK
jgi:hypothetical protein